jgi:long-chain fatty acid transport protein
MRKSIIALTLGASAGTASANGFVLNDHGAAATGRGDATVATDTEGSAFVHNIGGISGGRGIGIYLGASLIFPSSSFDCTSPTCAGTSTSTESPMAVTPQAFFTARINDLIAVGFGFHTPFGSKIVWPDDAPVTDEVHTQALRTYFLTPAVGLNLDKFVPGLRVGAGVDLVPSTVDITQDIFFGESVRGSAHLGGNAFGYGFRAGVQYTPKMFDKLSVGVAYRSEVTLDFDGKGDFDIEDPFRGQLPMDGDIATSITLPQSILGGIAYRPLPALEVELDGVWMGWSSFDELRIELPDGTETVSPRGYEDTLTIRFGAEYKLRKPLLALDFRAGYIWDPTPIPSNRLSSSLPDIDRHVLTAGAGYHFTKNYKVDAGVVWVMPGEHETGDVMYEPTYKGTYNVSAVVASLTLSGRFGDTAEPAPSAVE